MLRCQISGFVQKQSSRGALEKDVLRNFTKFHKTCNFIKKENMARVFPCEFCEISENTFYIEHLRWLLLFV